MKSTRGYTMRARAQAMERNQRRILDAAVELLKARMRADIRLEDVARAAGTTVPTVLRAFGSRAELLDRALRETLQDIRTDLRRAEPGDIDASVTAWFDHYERYGDLVVRNLADESNPDVGPIVRTGRERHRGHVLRQLGPHLGDVPPEEREQRLDALVCACDVYTWKLLRRDMGRPRAQAERTMRQMIRALLGDG